MAIISSNRFPQIVAALTVLLVRSCLIDGEAVVCNESGNIWLVA
jgi:ATP-dependent DNA ligase